MHDPGETDLEGWQYKISDAVEGIPLALGKEHTWLMIGEVPIPASQQRMLDLNASCSRRYQLLGESPTLFVTLFVAHSRDARAMAGHYPPNCYPSSGWLMDDSESNEGEYFSELPDGTKMRLRQYSFYRPQSDARIRVINGFVLPGGACVSTLGEAAGVMGRAEKSRLGLIQFQMMFDGKIDARRTREVSADVMHGIGESLVQSMKEGREDMESAQTSGGRP